ncbi:MAG: tRNA adenosine(34) deaminase TadA [Candidatus Acidiferrales bacterium]|jgi:tRNA(adenine34) deaminase
MNNPIESDLEWMGVAIEEARRAGDAGEVPIGAVAVLEGREIATGANRTIRDCDPTAHAEMIALRAAAKAIGNYRLAGVALYVTIEPCSMCAGAIVQARIARVVYGADDPKGGAARSCFNVLDNPQLNHQVEFVPNLRAEECAALLQNFFATRR